MCCLVLAGSRERWSWRLSLFAAGNKSRRLVEAMSRLIALRCVQTRRDASGSTQAFLVVIADRRNVCGEGCTLENAKKDSL